MWKAAVLAAATLAGCAGGVSPEREAAFGRHEETYGACLRDGLVELAPSRETAEVVAAAVLAGCVGERELLNAAVYEAYGYTVAAEGWLSGYHRGRDAEVLHGIVATRAGIAVPNT